MEKLRVTKAEVQHIQLKGLVNHYWLMQGTEQSLINHKLLPVRSVDMIFNLGEPIRYIDAKGKNILTHNFHISSPKTCCRTISQKGIIKVFGITFRPSGFYMFADSKMEDVHDENPYVRTRIDMFRQNIFEILDQKDIYDAVNEIEGILINNINNQLFVPGNLEKIMNIFYQKHSEIRLKDFCREQGFTTRGLEKQFKKYLGLSPKYFLKLCRFRDLIKKLEAGQYKNLVDISHMCYYDQSHFIREFKSLAGSTPSKFVKTKQWVKDEMKYD